MDNNRTYFVFTLGVVLGVAVMLLGYYTLA